MIPDTALNQLMHELGRAGLDVRTDRSTRLLYSTDASIYQVEPLGVAFPRHTDELQAIVEGCARHGVPLLARGAGSSLGGQAVGEALIVDTARHLNRLLAVDPEMRIATAEPGIVLNALNRALARHGLQFGPDPASAERATLGGSMANNAAGAHSIVYGMCADHILSAEVLLSDGTQARWGEICPGPGGAFAAPAPGESPYSGRSAAVLQAVDRIRTDYGEAIRRRWPKTWRRASGYNLNYLLPWTPSAPPFWDAAATGGLPYPPLPPGAINLAQLLAGSEGTLAVMKQLTIRLAPLARQTVLAAFAFPSLAEACEATPPALESGPTAVELIPGVLVKLARSVPAYAAQLSILNALGGPGDEPPAMLVVEFSGSNPAELRAQAEQLRQRLAPGGRWLLAESAAAQKQIWTVRKVGLGLIMSRPGDWRPYSFIEDLAVPVERLGEFVRGMERILDEHGLQGENYGHASAGCLHIRPILNLKTAAGVAQMRSVAQAAVTLTLSLGGAVSGEHADGLARSEWYAQMFGAEINAAFRLLKQAADPHNLFNPGKMVSPDERIPPPRMDENLRFGGAYQARAWAANLDFSPQAGLAPAIEQCNGAGVCRKAEGVMCPSFQATQEELHSTRGRSNLLRALISGRFPDAEQGEQAVYQALDLCLACKGCKAECPSGVDVAKLKYDYLDHYYRRHTRKLRDYLFGYIGPIARLGGGLAPLTNRVMNSRGFAWLLERGLGVSAQRRWPRFASRRLAAIDKMRIANNKHTGKSNLKSSINQQESAAGETVLFLSDAFTEYMYPEIGAAALSTLRAAGCAPQLLPVIGA
ncbi:MAG: FAD-binding and (Fe-S)-binding domain-containing protein, partial [Chloroflexota bacterium]